MKIYRTNLLTKKTTCHAGYDKTPLHDAIKFLDHWADAEAKESRLTSTSTTHFRGNKVHPARTLLESDGTPVVRFFCKFD